MATYVISAFGYADIAVLVILVGLTLLCCLMGLSKSFKGFFCTVLAVLLSLWIVGLATDKVAESSLGVSLENALLSSSEGWGDAYTKTAVIQDGTVCVLVDGAPVSITTAGGGNIIGNFAAKLLAPKFINADNSGQTTLAQAIVSNLTAFIVAACFFVVCLIILLIIAALLRKALGAANEAGKIGKALDKILGAVVGAVFGLMIVFVALAIIKACQNVGSTQSIIDTYITSGPISNFFYTHNFVGDTFEKIFVA